MSQIDRSERRERPVRRRAALLGALLATLAGSAGAQPQIDPHDPAVRFQTVQERGISLRQAIALAQQRYQGTVVRAETKTQNGRRVHEIRILGDDGRVRTLHFDADGGGR